MMGRLAVGGTLAPTPGAPSIPGPAMALMGTSFLLSEVGST